MKKICVLYGNCHMGGVIEILKKTPEFLVEYEIYPIKFIQNMKLEDLNHPIFTRCDLFIHQSIRKENRYGEIFASENVIKRLKSECKVVAIPNVYGLPTCFFPQFVKGNEYKRSFPNKSTCFFRDKIIENTLIDGGSVKEVFQKYTDRNLYERADLQEEWERFIDKIRMRERDWDIKIADWLEKQKWKRLFLDPNHPTSEFLKYISFKLLIFLGINVEEDSIMSLEISDIDPYEIPICEAVSKYFAMDYDVRVHELRKNGIKLFPGHMNLKRYIIQYYCMVWREKKMPAIVRIKSFFCYCFICVPGAILNLISLYYKALRRKFIIMRGICQ